MLSQYKVGMVEDRTCNSLNSDSNHVSSTMALATALYLASVEERDTNFCFLDAKIYDYDPRISCKQLWMYDHLCSQPNLHQRKHGEVNLHEEKDRRKPFLLNIVVIF